MKKIDFEIALTHQKRSNNVIEYSRKQAKEIILLFCRILICSSASYWKRNYTNIVLGNEKHFIKTKWTKHFSICPTKFDIHSKLI